MSFFCTSLSRIILSWSRALKRTSRLMDSFLLLGGEAVRFLRAWDFAKPPPLVGGKCEGLLMNPLGGLGAG